MIMYRIKAKSTGMYKAPAESYKSWELAGKFYESEHTAKRIADNMKEEVTVVRTNITDIENG